MVEVGYPHLPFRSLRHKNAPAIAAGASIRSLVETGEAPYPAHPTHKHRDEMTKLLPARPSVNTLLELSYRLCFWSVGLWDVFLSELKKSGPHQEEELLSGIENGIGIDPS